MNRKAFVHAASLSAASLLISPPVFKENASKIKAIAFDAFAIFDPVEIFRKIDELFPGKGKQIIEVWQSRQFSYQWLRVTANKYKNFENVSKNALDFALAQSGVDLSGTRKKIDTGEV
jgi:2-haloacid dehalogenase